MAEYRIVLFFMAEDVVDVDSINSFIVKFDVKESARLLEFTFINNTWWTKESVMDNIYNQIFTFTESFPIFLLKLTLFLSETIKCTCVAKLAWSGFSALRPASFTNIGFCYVLFYTAALPRLAVPSKLKYDVCRKMLYSNTKMYGISPLM
jgi:hypothetical protein